MRRCKVCRAQEFDAATTDLHRTVAGTTFAATLTAMKCRACGDTELDPMAATAFELQVAAELVRMGRPTAEAFRFMRKALGFRGPQLAELLGVDRGTLSRWENGVLRVDRGAFVVLGGLVIERLSGRDDTLARLKALHKPVQASSTVVRIECTRAGMPSAHSTTSPPSAA
ncbi:MAG TPA: helix-turn-helix domain-containing protein [Polyangiales bacterium]